MTKEKNGINKYFSRLIVPIQQKFRNFLCAMMLPARFLKHSIGASVPRC